MEYGIGFVLKYSGACNLIKVYFIKLLYTNVHINTIELGNQYSGAIPPNNAGMQKHDQCNYKLI